ncbi:MAG TPA: hypothetical protein VFW02_04045, partial [Candidatus Limnocylindrales bacterium]|nr:hypothetical protein [Candidatus Limnocylindrales bacterium]
MGGRPGHPQRPEPESIEADAPRAPIRPDQGYRVGARISVGDAGRTRLAGAVALGIILTGIALAAIGPLLPQLPEIPIAPVPSRAAASPLPAVAILRPPATTRFVPVAAGGLRWLDPATGSMSGDAYTSPRGSMFVDALGHGLCVCLEIPWSDGAQVTRVTLRRYSSAGEEVDRATLYELAAVDRRVAGPTIQVDAAISPDGAHLWIAHSVLGEAAWEIGVDRVDLATMSVDAARVVDSIPVPASAEAGVIATPGGWAMDARSAVRATIRVSPDGARVAIVESVFTDPDLAPDVPPFQQGRLVVDSRLGADLPEAAVPAHDAGSDTCDSELSGWATDGHFVTICNRPAGDGVQPYVRIEDGAEPGREVTVGPPVGTNDSEWLLDNRQGVLYRWSTFAHVFSRLDVPSGRVTTVTLEQARAGVGDLGVWPAGGARDWSPWAPLAGPDVFVRPPRMVGSENGTLIYALGYRSVADALRDDRVASTGIWVLDAARTELVAHWAP